MLPQAAGLAALLSVFAPIASSQATPVERTFRESKAVVEKTLKQLQPSMSGRLPALDGFALVGDHPFTRYQRAFYQCTAQVSATPSGGTVVRVSAKVTAWYADANAARSGYQLLNSNGRLESDLLDELSERLSNSSKSSERKSSESVAGPTSNEPANRSLSKQPVSEQPVLSAPMPQTSENSAVFSSPNGKGLTASPMPGPATSVRTPPKEGSETPTEAAALELVLKNQAHPKNLVAVKKSGTPVVAAPSLTGKTLFLASEHDEFEMLDFNNDWVHVRVSGLARGWIWRTSLEMPGGISDVPQAVATSGRAAGDLFQVSREERAPFPGDWEPLRGKSVKIISVQKVQENEKGSGAEATLEFAKSLLDKNYADLAAQSAELAGIVLIFDSVDGGMIAATLPTVQQWKAGALTDAALWHHCYFDPPETFSASSPASP
jgi:hypothetical protein